MILARTTTDIPARSGDHAGRGRAVTCGVALVDGRALIQEWGEATVHNPGGREYPAGARVWLVPIEEDFLIVGPAP